VTFVVGAGGRGARVGCWQGRRECPYQWIRGRLNLRKEGLPRRETPRVLYETKGGPCNVVRRIGPQPQAPGLAGALDERRAGGDRSRSARSCRTDKAGAATGR